MKRLYTLALSALVLAASATVAVPTAKFAKSRISELRSERVKGNVAEKQTVKTPELVVSSPRKAVSVAAENRLVAEAMSSELNNVIEVSQALNVKVESAKAEKALSLTARKTGKSLKGAPRKAVPEGEWTKLEGQGKWFEGLLSDAYGFSPIGYSWAVDVEESATTPGYYRIQPGLEGSKMVDLFGETDDVYFYINATNPEKVYVDGDVTYFGEIFSQMVTENEWKDNAANYGTLVDNVITFPATSFANYYNGDWYTANSEGAFKIGLPGSDVKDLGFAINNTGICSANGKQTVYISAGSDIASLKYYATSGRFTVSDDNAAVVNSYGTAVNVLSVGPFNFANPGIYTVFMNAYDADGNFVKCCATHFIVPEAEDADNWKVVEGYTAKVTDGMFAALGVPAEEMDIILEENVNTPGLYRYEAPYASHSAMAANVVDHEGIHKHYVVINATRPDSVYMEPSILGLNIPGFSTVYGYSYGASYAATGQLSQLPASYFGTKTETEITLPAGAAFLCFSNEPYLKLYNATLKITLTPVKAEEPEPTVVEFTAEDFTFGNNEASASKDGFYLGFSKDSGSTKPAVYNDNIRLYAKGTMTIGATQITKVVITLASDAAAKYGEFTPSVGAYTTPQASGDTELTWEGDAASVVFTAGEKATFSSKTTDACQIRIAKVTVYGTPGDGKAPAAPVVEVANIKEFLDAANKTENTTITGDVTVTYQNGKYLFVTDATGSLEVYGEVGKTYTNGTKLTGISGKYSEYGKMPQLVPVVDSFTAGTEGAAVDPVEYDANSVQIAQYVVMTDVEITSTTTDDKTNYYVGDVQLYKRFDLEDLELKEAEKATVIGIYAIFNSTKELFVISVDYDEQGGDDPVPPTPGEGVTVADVVGDYEVSYTVELEGADDYDGEMTVVAGEGENALVFNFPFDFYGEYLWNLKATLDSATGNITFKLADQQPALDDAICEFRHWDSAAGGWTDVTEIVANYDGQTVVFDEDDAFALKAESGGYYTLFDMIEMTKVDPNADPNEGWKSLGNAKLMDGWVLPAIGVNQAENIYEVELQQNETNENIYRLVDPYHGKSPVAQYNECEKIGYIEFDVTDPDYVLFSNIKAGFGNSELGISNIYCYDEMSYFCNMLGTTPAETNELLVQYDEDPISGSTYKSGVVTVKGTLFGISAADGGYTWTDENDDPANMEAAIWFPGVSPELDSIKEVNSAADNSKVYYNLRGQRISKPTTAGIYILNNQKVYVK